LYEKENKVIEEEQQTRQGGFGNLTIINRTGKI